MPDPVPVNPIVPSSIRPPVSPLTTYPTYKNEPSITSLQVRQEKEAQLRANDQHWQRRLTQLEETHAKINQLMEQEFNSAVCNLSSYQIIFYTYFKCIHYLNSFV